MKYFGGCDVGSTFTKAVILDETGKMVADTTRITAFVNVDPTSQPPKYFISCLPPILS